MLKHKKEAMTAVKMEYHYVATKKCTGKHGADKKVVWAKVHTAKALEETANLGSRMGQLDGELEKYFNFLDRMRTNIWQVCKTLHRPCQISTRSMKLLS